MTIPPAIPALAYTAPALEKGLDILEALAETQDGLTQQEVAFALRRSVGEIFRMLEVLRRRGWVSRDPDTGRHALTTRMFELSHRHPPTPGQSGEGSSAYPGPEHGTEFLFYLDPLRNEHPVGACCSALAQAG